MPLIQKYWGLQRFLWLAAPAITLVVTPQVTQDPINIIKLFFLAIAGMGSVAAIFWMIRHDSDRLTTTVKIIFVVFVCALVITFLISGSNKSQSFFGASGRNTGLLAYLSLSFIALGVAMVSDDRFLVRFSCSILITGIISLAYSLLQNFHHDPFPWINPNSPMIGFLGNSNFNSSFLGLFCVMTFALLLHSARKDRRSLVLIPLMFLTVYTIYLTDSIQGLLVALIGCALLLLFTAISRGNVKAVVALSSTSALVGLFGVLGFLNRGPAAPYIFGDTLVFRRDYWMAGWKMTFNHPIFGIGLDGYGDWYRRSRTLEATLRRGPDITTNAAHNVFLDFSSNGGIILLFSYLALIFLTLVSIRRILKFGQNVNYLILGVIATWAAFQAQALISINQIGLAIWGWVMMGIIIGYDRLSSAPQEKIADKKKKNLASVQLPAGLVVSLFIGSAIGFAAAIPLVIADSKVQTSLEAGNAERLSEAAQKWPQNPTNMARVAAILRENKLDSLALKTAQRATQLFPDSYPAWEQLSLATVSGSQENLEALVQMKRLDPLNPNLK
jgi:O-antigen ligase